MKRLIFFMIVFSPFMLFSQTHWKWGLNGYCVTDDWGSNITTDKSGNVYVAGVFTNVLSMGDSILSSYGDFDLFLAKYDYSGQLKWLKNAGSVLNEEIGAIVTDDSDNIYVTGYFTDTCHFSEFTITSKGASDIFLVKYNSSGDVVWAKGFGSQYNDIGRGLCVISKKIWITGVFSDYGGSPSVYGTIDFDTIQLTSNGDGDIFLMSADFNGNIISASNYGNSLTELGSGLATDLSQSLYLTGSFYSHLSLDSCNIYSISSGFVLGDYFVAKFDSNGKALWARPVGGAGTWSSVGGAVGIKTLSVSASGNLYITGTYHHCSMVFHDGTSLPFESQFHVFLAKYNTNGGLLWKRGMGGPSWNGVGGLWQDKDENIFVSGLFHTSGVFGIDSIIGYGSDDAFVTKYDSSGNEQWVVNMGGNDNEGCGGISGDSEGNLYVTGAFSSLQFNYGNNSLTNSGDWDLFLLKLSTDITGLPQLPGNKSEANIYPNPTTGMFTIQSGKIISELIITDQLGREVFQRSGIGSNSLSVDLSHLSDGVYYLRLLGKQQMPVIKKLIIHH